MDAPRASRTKSEMTKTDGQRAGRQINKVNKQESFQLLEQAATGRTALGENRGESSPFLCRPPTSSFHARPRPASRSSRRSPRLAVHVHEGCETKYSSANTVRRLVTRYISNSTPPHWVDSASNHAVVARDAVSPASPDQTIKARTSGGAVSS